MDNGVVMSLNPCGIIFVPEILTKLVIDQEIEVIYSFLFSNVTFNKLVLPKSLKKIYQRRFFSAAIDELVFEDGSELDFINAFFGSSIDKIKFPSIKDHLDHFYLNNSTYIGFSPSFNLEFVCNKAGFIMNKNRKIIIVSTCQESI